MLGILMARDGSLGTVKFLVGSDRSMHLDVGRTAEKREAADTQSACQHPRRRGQHAARRGAARGPAGGQSGGLASGPASGEGSALTWARTCHRSLGGTPAEEAGAWHALGKLAYDATCVEPAAIQLVMQQKTRKQVHGAQARRWGGYALALGRTLTDLLV